MLTTDMVSMLCCPTCHDAELQLSTEERDTNGILDGSFLCKKCASLYSFSGGAADLLPRVAAESKDWREWREHLDGFLVRREQRLHEPDLLVNTVGAKGSLHPAFAEFVNISSGCVLDVGCGPGKLRTRFDESRVRYIGLDPLILPEVAGFRFVRALGEYIPFRRHTFSDVVALASLDHVRDVPAFFKEIRRVLEPDGRFHLIQSTHEARGPISALKFIGHWIKDKVEDRMYESSAPHHMTEFTRATLLDTLSRDFDVVQSEPHSRTWYSPTNLFVTMTPK